MADDKPAEEPKPKRKRAPRMPRRSRPTRAQKRKSGYMATCPTCRGGINKASCPLCDGSGEVWVNP